MENTQDNFTNSPAWPVWLEGYLCPDSQFEEAYNSLPATFRAALKTAIAAAFFHFGQNDSAVSTYLENKAKGFWSTAQSRPAPWALPVFDEQFNAPARLIAACILPALCGVPLIGACCLGQKPAAGVLLALELCGVENLFCLDENLLHSLMNEMGPGRLVLLHGRDWMQTVCLAAELHIPCITEQMPPNLYVQDAGAFDLDAIAMAQDVDKQALTDRDFNNQNPSKPVDALYLRDPASYSGPDIPLLLGPGLEAFWLWPDLSPDFFRSRNLALGMV